MDEDRSIARRADPSLLDAGAELLPADLGAPPPPAAPGGHDRLVGAGVALTGLTLLGGSALALAGLVSLILGAGGLLGVAGLVVGVLLVATHWGWIHIAQATADGRQREETRRAQAIRQRWLDDVAPYPRWELRSRVRAEDAAVVLERRRFDPVPIGDAGFGFTVVVERAEAHDEDEPAAVVAARAEELRRDADEDTARSRARFEAAAETADLDRHSAADDRERLAAQTAGARALSEQINAHARRPPLSG